MYVKLFGTIVTSSIWNEDLGTRLVWITLLATANEEGWVRSTVEGLARTANVDLATCRKAVEVLEAPDTTSGSPKENGRRILPKPGGWQVVNYQEYREIKTQKQMNDARRQRELYARRKEAEDV